MPGDREQSSLPRYDQQRRVVSRGRRSAALAALSWSAMVLSATGSLLLLGGGTAVQIDPANPGFKPTLGYFCVAVALVLVASTPLVRPLALGLRWLRMGDYRFAAAAIGVVAVMLLAAILK
ncbi:MAG: hypothetical protein DCC49_10250 [Acidobacteria bacterium]|nr:MAG: hypothetical protein DCC49_10250 [Acidobacteriota bacterium]